MSDGQSAGRHSIPERVATLEAQQGFFKDQASKIDDIHTGVLEARLGLRTILERLDVGDRRFDTINRDLKAQDERLDDHEKTIKPLAGGDGRPSFAELQNAHMRRGWASWLINGIWVSILGGLTACGGYFGIIHWPKH